MLRVCRICLLFITTNEQYFEIEPDNLPLSEKKNRYKVTSLLPEMNLNVSKDSVICNSCRNKLEEMFDFKLRCLKTETMIIHYMQSKGLSEANVDLKHVALVYNGLVEPQSPFNNVEIIEVSSSNLPANSKNSLEGEIIDLDCYANKNTTAVLPETPVLNSLQRISNVGHANKTIIRYPELIRQHADHNVTKHFYSEDQISCNICFKIFRTQIQLERHVEHCNTYKPNVEQDNNTIIRYPELIREQEDYNITKNFYSENQISCNICFKIFRTQSLLDRHVEYCNTSNTTKEHESLYVQNDERVQLHSDDANDDDFEVDITPLGYLIPKKKKVSIKKNFACLMCSKKFRTNTGLSFHVKRFCTKKNDKYAKRAYRKAIKCNNCKFKNMLPIGENPFKCSICEQMFENYNAYKWHKKYVHKSKPYDCKVCKYTFTSKKDLLNHKCNPNSDEQCVVCKVNFTPCNFSGPFECLYKCQVCNDSFSVYDNYKWHMRQIHRES